MKYLCLIYDDQKKMSTMTKSEGEAIMGVRVRGLGACAAGVAVLCLGGCALGPCALSESRLRYNEAAFEKRIRKPPEAAGLLRKFRDRLATLEPFDAATLDKEMQDFVRAEGIAIGQIIHALRVAVTGKAIGFGLFDTFAILGRERSLARIDQALKRLSDK